MPRRSKKTPFLSNINITEKFAYAVHAVMSFREHILLATQVDCKLLTVEDRIPTFATRAEFQSYVVSSKSFLGIYLDEDKKTTEIIKKGLEREQMLKDEDTARKVSEKRRKQLKPLSRSKVDKIVKSSFFIYDLAFNLTKFHLMELSFYMILSKGKASKVIDPLTSVQYLTAKFIQYINV